MKSSFIPAKLLSTVLVVLLSWGGPVAVFAQQASMPDGPAAQVQGAVAQGSSLESSSLESSSVESVSVNINTASAEAIAAALTGIGLAKAQAIVAWRDANGAFTHVEQLLEVKGIGQATLDKNTSRISL